MGQRDALALRAASAAVMAAIAITGAAIGGWTFNFLIALIAVLIAFEWDRLTGGPVFGPFGTMMAGTAVTVAVLTGTGRMAGAFLVVALAAALIGMLARGRGRDPRWLVGGLLYLAIPCIAGVWIRDTE
mgnify:FL=1